MDLHEIGERNDEFGPSFPPTFPHCRLLAPTRAVPRSLVDLAPSSLRSRMAAAGTGTMTSVPGGLAPAQRIKMVQHGFGEV